MTISPSRFLDEGARPANHNLPLKDQLRKSVILTALENLMKLDDDPAFRKHVCHRYLSLKDGTPKELDF